MAASPTQLTKRHFERLGYICDVVERWNPHANIRQDMFGIIDVVCVGNGETIAVQCTSYSNISKRVNKIADAEATPFLREAGWKIVVQGWHKPRHRWVVREVDCS